MKGVATLAFAAALGLSSGCASQTGPQVQASQPIEETRIEGMVQDVGQDALTLAVAGSTVEFQADQRQLQGIERGDVVQVTAVPLPEVESVKTMQQATRTERQEAMLEDKSFVGNVRSVQKDIATIETQSGERHVKLKSDQAQLLQQGQEYYFALSSAPEQAENWRATRITRM